MATRAFRIAMIWREVGGQYRLPAGTEVDRLGTLLLLTEKGILVPQA